MTGTLKFRRLSDLRLARRVERWVPVLRTRHFDGAYRRLGMSMADFVHVGGNVWESRDGRFRVRAYVSRGRSRRVVEVKTYEEVWEWDDPAA